MICSKGVTLSDFLQVPQKRGFGILGQQNSHFLTFLASRKYETHKHRLNDQSDHNWWQPLWFKFYTSWTPSHRLVQVVEKIFELHLISRWWAPAPSSLTGKSTPHSLAGKSSLTGKSTQTETTRPPLRLPPRALCTSFKFQFKSFQLEWKLAWYHYHHDHEHDHHCHHHQHHFSTTTRLPLRLFPRALCTSFFQLVCFSLKVFNFKAFQMMWILAW